MMNYSDLEELCHTLGEKLAEANEKIRKAGGEISESDVGFVDKLTHSIKSLKTTMAMMDSEGYSGYGGNSGYGNAGNGTSGNYSGNYSGNRSGGRGYSGYADGASGRYSGKRGRGSYAKRDSMGRYSSSDGTEEFLEQLRELVQDAPDDRTRQEIERVVSKLEG